MTSFTGAFVLAYLLSVSFTDEVQLNLTPVQKLVDYEYNFAFSELVPGITYNGTIRADWAVPPSSLRGLEGKSVTVRVTASTDENSSLFFLSPIGTEAKEASAYLRCDVEPGGCANSSVLFAEIPMLASTKPQGSESARLLLKSEIVEGPEAAVAEKSRGDLLDAFKRAFEQNLTANSTSAELQLGEADLLNFSNGSGQENFLDSLKPAGDSKDPVAFLRENPLVSFAALAIVIVITGAYLLKSKE